MSDVKLCKDCRHVSYVRYVPFLPFVDKGLAKCCAPQAFNRIDPVNGNDSRYTDWCSSQRIGTFEDGRTCGKEGRWWEAK